MTITFDAPITVGNLTERVSVRSMELTTVAFNLLPDKPGEQNISLTLRDPVTGFQASFVYQDSSITPQFWHHAGSALCTCGCGKPWPTHLLLRLLSDQKIPPGAIS